MRNRDTGPATLPRLEKALAVAAERRADRSHVRGIGRRILANRASRFAAIGVACLAFGGTAMAAGVWNPSIGGSAVEGPVTTASSPVPTELTEALGVLRREPTAQDRSPEVEATLAGLWFVNGVRPDSARYLAPGAHEQATVVVSAEGSPVYQGKTEPACVYRPMQNQNHGDKGIVGSCFSAAEVLEGGAYMDFTEASEEGYAFGLVPDGVASVTAEFADAPAVTVPVANNYFEVPLSGLEVVSLKGSGAPAAAEITELGVSHVVWHDADGAVVPQAEGPHAGEPSSREGSSRLSSTELAEYEKGN